MGLVSTTTYRVETEMRAKDEMSAAFTAISRSADVAQKAIDQVKRGAALLGVGIGFQQAKKHLIDFNAGLEDSQVVMAGMLTMFTGAKLEKSWDRAGQSVATFNAMAAKSALTTKDLVNMASLIERPLLQAGVGMNQIEKVTFGAANASKAFGIGAEVAAMDIQQALGAGVHIRDRFMISLLAQKGIDYTPTKFNALTTAKRVEVITKATQSDAILAMAKKQGEDTFHGVTSTLEDNLSLLAGRAGLPLFKEITHEVQRWNAWLEKNADSVERMSKAIGSGLVSGFKQLKEYADVIASHADTLMAIGKVWAAVKLGGIIGGGLGMGGGNLAAISQAFAPMGTSIGNSIRAMFLSTGIRFPGLIGPMSAVASGLSKFGGVLGALGPGGVLGIGFAAHELGEYLGVHRALTAVIDPTRVKLEHLTKSMENFDESVKRAAASVANEKGAKGSQSSINAIGAVEQMKQNRHMLEHMLAGATGSTDWQRRLNLISGRKNLDSTDYTSDEKNKFTTPSAVQAEIDRLRDKIANVSINQITANRETDWGITEAMKLMSASEKASIDLKVGQQLINSEFMQLFSSSGYRMTGLNEALMSPVEIKKKLLSGATDPFKGASINQNITNHIQVEVSAKDPDRWLRELDEKVQRKIKAPSQARGSIITRGGL